MGTVYGTNWLIWMQLWSAEQVQTGGCAGQETHCLGERSKCMKETKECVFLRVGWLTMWSKRNQRQARRRYGRMRTDSDFTLFSHTYILTLVLVFNLAPTSLRRHAHAKLPTLRSTSSRTIKVRAAIFVNFHGASARRVENT